MKIGYIGIVFLVPTRTAFVPGGFSFPGSAWERKGRAPLLVHDRQPAGRAWQAGRARAEPGHEGHEFPRGQSMVTPVRPVQALRKSLW